MIRKSRHSGFTLVETLVAMGLISAVLLPACFWLYRSQASRAAGERFHALQVLETRMNRAQVACPERDIREEITGHGYMRLEIRISHQGSEAHLSGSIRNRKGRVLANLQSACFKGGIP